MCHICIHKLVPAYREFDEGEGLDYGNRNTCSLSGMDTHSKGTQMTWSASHERLHSWAMSAVTMIK